MEKTIEVFLCPTLGKFYTYVKFEHFFHFFNKIRKNFQNVYGNFIDRLQRNNRKILTLNMFLFR